jgi:hypothetical protein
MDGTMEPDIGIVEMPFANVVIRSFGATPWRFGAADYVAAGGAALRPGPDQLEIAPDLQDRAPP